jgi:hypothetical protein
MGGSRSRWALVVAPFLLAACAVDVDETVAQQSVAGGQEKVLVCHVPPGNPENMHTIVVGGPSVVAHLAHGDSVGECQVDEPVECPCYNLEGTYWNLASFGGLYCTAPVPGGRLSVCSAFGEPACVAFAGDGSSLPMEVCEACLPLNTFGITDCSEVAALIET